MALLFSCYFLDTLELIGRRVDQIPEKHFKMIRYYGFLSNRRGEMPPKVYEELEQEGTQAPAKLSFAAMLKGYVNIEPFKCILCGCDLIFKRLRVGTRVSVLVSMAKTKAKYIPV